MKKRRIPRNPDCPLTKFERHNLCRMLDELEWKEYQRVKHRSGGYTEIKVTEYDELEITAKLLFGVDGEWHDYDYIVIQRSELLIIT